MDASYSGNKDVQHFDIRGLHLWLFKKVGTIIRFKKMNKDGYITGIRTKQMEDYDDGNELPGLPPIPLRLSAGYWENETGTKINRTQIAKPSGKIVEWSAAILPSEKRQEGSKIWEAVVQQHKIA